MKLLKSFLFVASLIISIKADLASKKIEELKHNKQDFLEYKNANCIERDIPFNERSQLDIYYDSETKNIKKPVVIQFHGGTWYDEDKMNCVSSGLLLNQNNYITVIPNYILFPYGEVEDMIDDVYSSILWTFNNVEVYGGDINDITIVAHSSSAHLLILTLIKAAFVRKNKGISVTPLPNIKRVVLINGQYEFSESMLQNISNNDTEDDLFKEMSLAILGLNDNSPVEILKEYNDNSLTSFGIDKLNVVYSSLDNLVTESSAKSLMDEIKRICPTFNIQYIYLEGLDHNGIPNGLRDKVESIQNAFVQLIKL
ncbi:alpha/beta-hydrolase [Anaeromyces robustus]|uniref:Alpha/beta-hydrolase n=1 Tax=Anaeromyces robustus TaxID=1754192 RepID=A0A1Y1XEC0_9FUNG|nr:alpha/beta-hydrolase [Anaeromyces robustus]|eukprot:ORX84089.1 alpha/beta-hydrolase [Anaeromyces robustus]